MAKRNRNNLKEAFKTGNIPTGQDFSDFIDSVWNLEDDGEGIPGPTGATGPSGTNTNYYPISFRHDEFNPNSGFSYYIGDVNDISTSSNDKSKRYSLIDGIVNKVYHHYNVSSVGSSEPSAIYLTNITTGISEQLTTSASFDSFSTLSVYTLGTPLTVSFGDSLEIRIEATTWSSPPIGVSGIFEVLVEY